jgi:hypothetical protein
VLFYHKNIRNSIQVQCDLAEAEEKFAEQLAKVWLQIAPSRQMRIPPTA